MNFANRYKKIIPKVLVLALLIIAPIAFSTAHAQWWVASVAQTVGKVAAYNPLDTLFSNLLYVPMAVCAWILGLAGVILNSVLDYTVVNMSVNLKDISGINVAWATIRDLANMSFIFVLLYIAISTVLGLSGANWKKTLGSVVIVAVLINFSLFITKVVIDASNVFTLGIYRQIVPNADTRVGLSNSIMQPLGITTIYNVNDTDGSTKLARGVGGDISKMAIVSLGSSVFMIITAFVFLAVSIMFIIRYITIIFLLILSPVAIMAFVLPQLSGTAKKWQAQLIGQAIFAPVYMILMWVTLTIIQSDGFVCPGAKWSDTFQGLAKTSSNNLAGGVCSGSEVGLIINFAIVIGMTIASITLAKSTSEQGSAVVGKVVGGALGFGAGAVAFGGRRTVGMVGQKAADSKWLKDRAATSRLANMALIGANKTAKGTFDLRNVKVAGQSVSNLGVGGKAGGKDGYSGMLKKNIETYENRGKALEASDQGEKDKLKAERNSKESVLLSQMQAERTTVGPAPKSDPTRIAEEAAIESTVKNLNTELASAQTQLTGDASTNAAAVADLAAIDNELEEAKKEVVNVPELDKQANEKVAEIEARKNAMIDDHAAQKGTRIIQLEKDKQAADELFAAKRAARIAEEQRLTLEHRSAQNTASAATKSKLEKLGWTDEDKTNQLSGDKLKKYNDEQKKKRDDYESGKTRSVAYGDRISYQPKIRIPLTKISVGVPFTTNTAKRRGAEKLRKGGKKAEDYVMDLMKATGEIKDKEPKEEKEEKPAEAPKP